MQYQQPHIPREAHKCRTEPFQHVQEVWSKRMCGRYTCWHWGNLVDAKTVGTITLARAPSASPCLASSHRKVLKKKIIMKKSNTLGAGPDVVSCKQEIWNRKFVRKPSGDLQHCQFWWKNKRAIHVHSPHGEASNMPHRPWLPVTDNVSMTS